MQPGLSLYNAFILQELVGGGKAEEDDVRQEKDRESGSERRRGGGLFLSVTPLLLTSSPSLSSPQCQSSGTKFHTCL